MTKRQDGWIRQPTTPADTDHLVDATGQLDIAAHTGFFVYRLWGSEGNLLYVGQTTNLIGRLQGHRNEAVFRHQIALLTYEQMPTKRSMDDREAALIRDLQPPHNTTGVNRNTRATLTPGTANPHIQTLHKIEARQRARELGELKAKVANALTFSPERSRCGEDEA